MAFTAMVGARIRRREDPRLITGRATYVDDVKQVGMVYAAFVRSIYGHAKLTKVDVARARSQPGVLAAYAGADLRAQGMDASLPVAHKLPNLKAPPHHLLAIDEVRFVGEPIAVVVATSPYAARDALEAVEVAYEELPVVVDPLKAAAGPPYVHADLGTNVAFTMPLRAGDPDESVRGSR